MHPIILITFILLISTFSSNSFEVNGNSTSADNLFENVTSSPEGNNVTVIQEELIANDSAVPPGKNSNSSQDKYDNNISGIYLIQHSYSGKFLTGYLSLKSEVPSNGSDLSSEKSKRKENANQRWRIQMHPNFRDRYTIHLEENASIPLSIDEEYLEPFYEKLPATNRLWIVKSSGKFKWKLGLIDYKPDKSEILCLSGPTRGGKKRKIEMTKCSSDDKVQDWYLIRLTWTGKKWECETLESNKSTSLNYSYCLLIYLLYSIFNLTITIN